MAFDQNSASRRAQQYEKAAKNAERAGKAMDKLASAADRFASAGAASATRAATGGAAEVSGKLEKDSENAHLFAKSMERAERSTSDLGKRLTGSLSKGLDPLLVAITRMEQEMDRATGTIITGFRRADSAAKFPLFDAALSKIKAGLSGFGTGVIGAAKDAKQGLGSVAPILVELDAKLNKPVPDRFARIGQQARLAGAAVRSLAQSFAIAGAAESASEKRARQRRERAGRPGVGRAIPLAGEVSAEPVTRLGAAYQLLTAAAKGASLASFSLGEAVVRSTSRSLGVLTSIIQKHFRWTNITSSLGDVAGKTYSQIYRGSSLIVGAVKLAASGTLFLGKQVLRIGTLGAFGRASREAKSFGSSVDSASRSTQALGSRVAGVGREIAVALGAFGLIFKGVQFLKDGVAGAVALNETLNVTKETFGDFAGQIESMASKNSKDYGFNKQVLLDTANSFGAIYQGVGKTEKESSKLAQVFSDLTLSAVSFRNVDIAEAAGKIRGVLAGNAEGVKEWGILITEADVKSRALSMGLTEGKGEISSYAKVMARASLVTEGLKKASGDLERTSGSAANQFRKAGGGIENFGVAIGQALLPAVSVGVAAFNDLLDATITVFEGMSATMASWSAYVGQVFAGVGVLVRNWGAYWEVAKLRVGAFVENTIAYLDVLPQNFAIVSTYVITNWRALLDDLLSASQAAFTNLLGNAQNFGSALWDAIQGKGFNFTWQPLLDGFEATAAKLPELIKPHLIDVSGEVARILGEVTEKETARALSVAQKAAPGGAKNAASALMEKAPEVKLAGLAEKGSKEAYQAIAKFRAGGSADKPIKDVAKTTREQLAEAKEQTKTLRQIAQASGGLAKFTF